MTGREDGRGPVETATHRAAEHHHQTGGTVVSAGRLDVAGAPGGSLGITVNSGAVLQFTNTVNNTVQPSNSPAPKPEDS